MLRRSVRRRSRLSLVAAALALGALGVAAALALAAHPVAGAKYKGQIDNDPFNTKISFKVSNDGDTVKGLKTKFDPAFPSGGCTEETPGVEQESDPAHISRKGKFKGVIHYSFNGVTAKAVVKGKFRRHGRAAGSVTSTFEANPSCDGTGHFETKVD
jgi:hypothetical protein